MKIAFSAYPSSSTELFFHRIYQVVFLNLDDSELDIWTSLIVSQKYQNDAPVNLIIELSVTDSAGENILSDCELKLPYDLDSELANPDSRVGLALRKVWGGRSIALKGPSGVTLPLDEIARTWPKNVGYKSNLTNAQIRHFSAISKDSDWWDALKALATSGKILGLFLEEADSSIIPFQSGTFASHSFDTASPRPVSATMLDFGAEDEKLLPSLWITRHKASISAEKMKRISDQLVEYEFTAPNTIDDDKGAIGEFRSYIVTPRLFDLDQNEPLRASLVSINTQANGTFKFSAKDPPIITDSNSLDKQEKSVDAYFPEWTTNNNIAERNYYKVNLPSSVRDYKRTYHRIYLNTKLISSFRDYRLFLWGIIVPTILAFGVDGDRLHKLDEYENSLGWTTFFHWPFSALFQWVIVSIILIALMASRVFGSRLEPNPKFLHLSSWSGRLRSGAVIAYALWVGGTFLISESVMSRFIELGQLEFIQWLGGVSGGILLAPRIFGLAAVVLGIAGLVAYLRKHKGLWSAVKGFLFGK